MGHDSVHARRQRLSIVHVEGAVHGGRVPPEQDSAQDTQDGDALQDALQQGSRPLAPSLHRSQNLRAHQTPQKARRRGLGREVRGCSEERKYYRVWNPKTRRDVESRNVTFIETQPHIFFWNSKLSPLQDLVPPSWDLDGDTLDNDYISYDDLLLDVRDYTGVLDFTANIPANHENASDVSADPQVQGSSDQIRDFTRRDLLTSAAPSPRAASPPEPLPGAAGGASPPRGASPKPEGARPAPMPATARRGAAIRNNRIRRTNVVTRRAVAELTGAVTRYWGVRHNNNHAALAERFRSSTNTDTPDTAHQLNTEVIAAEVVCTMSTHSRAVREGRIRPCPEHLQGGHGPPLGGVSEGRIGQGGRKSG